MLEVRIDECWHVTLNKLLIYRRLVLPSKKYPRLIIIIKKKYTYILFKNGQKCADSKAADRSIKF